MTVDELIEAVEYLTGDGREGQAEALLEEHGYNSLQEVIDDQA